MARSRLRSTSEAERVRAVNRLYLAWNSQQLVKQLNGEQPVEFAEWLRRAIDGRLNGESSRLCRYRYTKTNLRRALGSQRLQKASGDSINRWFEALEQTVAVVRTRRQAGALAGASRYQHSSRIPYEAAMMDLLAKVYGSVVHVPALEKAFWAFVWRHHRLTAHFGAKGLDL